jgi:hypothetical protein
MISSHSATHSSAQSGLPRALKMTFLWALLAVALHVLPGPLQPRLAHAQGSRKDDIVFNSRGIPLAGASVRVCTMPASGQPCTPLALIYSDDGLTQALANPTTTDGLGNYFFYAAPGQYEIEISGPGITDKQIPNVILPNDPSSPTFSGAVSAFSLSLGGNLTVSGSTTVVGSLASGTLTLSNQSTPPGAAATGTVNLYTKTADMRLYYKDQTGTEIGPLGPGNGAQTNVANTFTAEQIIDADFHTKGPNPSFDLTLFGGYSSGLTPPTITCSTTASSNQMTCSGGVADFTAPPSSLYGYGVSIPLAGAAPTMLTPGAPFPISSISVTSNVATVTLANSGSWAPGSNIVVSGSSDSTLNGTFAVSSLPFPTTLTFAVAHANCSPCSIGAGATLIAQTPSQVTPQGILNGTTTWNYKVVTIGFHGELSAASSAFTTTSGAATLGVNNASIATNGCVENNGIVTFTTTAAHNFQNGVPVNIPRNTTGSGSVEGSWVIASTPSSTTFTVNINNGLPNGTYCPSGGTAQVVAKNIVQWTMQPYAAMGYYVYRSQGSGAYTLVGATQGMDSAFIDFGVPGTPNTPTYVPSAPPTSTTRGILATTISSITGTTVTLATSAAATLTSATVSHDNAANILALCSAMNNDGGEIFLPASNPQGSVYLINSPLNLAAGCPSNLDIVLNGSLFINYPIIPGGADRIQGAAVGAGGNGANPPFQKYVTSRVQGNGYPMFLLEPGSSSDVTFQNLSLQCNQTYQSCFVQDEDNNGNNVTTIVYDNVYASGGSYAQPLKMGGGFNFFFRYGGIGTEALGWGIPPSLWDTTDFGLGAFQQQLASIVEFYYTDMGGGEWLFDTEGETGLAAGTGHLTFYEVLNESSYYPSLRFNTGANTNNAIHIERMTYADPVGGLATPMVDITNAPSISNLRVIEPFCATGAQAFFSGNTSGVDFVTGFSGCATGLPSTSVNIMSNLNGPSTSRTYNNVPVGVSGTGQFFYPMAVPAAPASAVVSSGGSVPVGTNAYALSAIDVNGNQTTLSPSISATTTSGNQTVTITPPASAPSGAVAYAVYRNGLFLYNSGGSCSNLISINGTTGTFVDIGGSACANNPPSANKAITSSMNSAGISTYQLKMANSFTDTLAPTLLSATRSQTLPDASGIVPVSSYLNSAYDNFNRANGAIGSNWTVNSGGLNVSSNALIGSNGATSNTAYYTAGAWSTYGQFAQLEISTLNGTNDFDGPMVMASSAGGYDCIEDSTTLIIQKVNGSSGSNLTSTSISGAAGDVLRLEAFLTPNSFPQSVTLTCYRNGAQALTTTDTTYTTGAPGLLLYNNVATVDNWSGGNLHPLAHLDREQDWSQPQHLLGNWTTCAMSSTTSCTATVPGAQRPNPASWCIAQEQGTGTAVAAECSISGTTVTVTAASSNSATWAIWVF